MPRKKTIRTSNTDIFWDLIEPAPGTGAGNCIFVRSAAGQSHNKIGPKSSLPRQKGKNIRHQIVAAMPNSLPGAVPKYLLGLESKLQPRQKPIKKRRRQGCAPATPPPSGAARLAPLRLAGGPQNLFLSVKGPINHRALPAGVTVAYMSYLDLTQTPQTVCFKQLD
jgi:hypothetical protein